MERDVMHDLAAVGLKKESLRKAFDQAQAQAASVLSFTVQWKDLESRFEATGERLLKRGQELDLQEKELREARRVVEQRENEAENRLKRVEECVDEYSRLRLKVQESELELHLARRAVEDCNVELSLKVERVGLVRKELMECSKELDARKKLLSMVENLVAEFSSDVASKEKELVLVRKDVEDLCVDIFVKTGELTSLEKLIGERSEELKRLEKLVGEETGECSEELKRIENLATEYNGDIESKDKELRLLREEADGFCEKICVKSKQLRSIETSVQERSQELEHIEKEVESRKGQVTDCNEELELKMKDLQRGRAEELQMAEKQLSEIRELVRKTSNDLDNEKARLHTINLLTEEKAKELEARKQEHDTIKKEHDTIKKSITVCSEELKLRETELELIEKCDCTEERKLKEKQIQSLLHSIVDCTKELKSMKDRKNTMQISIEQCGEELQSKENSLNLVKQSLTECCKELQSKEKNLDSVKESLTYFCEELQSKEKNLDSVKESLRDCYEELQSKEKNLDLVKKSLRDCCNELLAKKELGDSMNSLKKKLDERSEELVIKERLFEEAVNAFGLKEQQLHSLQRSLEERCKDLDLKENHLNSCQRIEQPENLKEVIVQCCNTGNGRKLLMLLNKHLSKHETIYNEVSTAIKSSLDPAKLVLDAMQGFFSPCLEKGEFDFAVVRRNCITLLEDLPKLSPLIKPHIREEAMKLAIEWKAKMMEMPENLLVVSGFLHLLAAFKLGSVEKAKELQSLLATVSQQSQETRLRKALERVHFFPGCFLLSRQVKVEQLSSPAHASADFSFGASTDERSSRLGQLDTMVDNELTHHEALAAIQSSPDPPKFVLEQLMKVSPDISLHVKEDARTLAIRWKENLRLRTENSIENIAFLLFLAAYGLVPYLSNDEIFGMVATFAQKKEAPEICRALGLTDKITDFIQDLIARKQYIEAVRFSCAFELVDKFPPVRIFRLYIESVMKAPSISIYRNIPHEVQCKAIDEAVVALMSILGCMADCKLEYRSLTEEINMSIIELEKRKTGVRASLKASPSTKQLEGVANRTTNMHLAQEHFFSPNIRDLQQVQSSNKRPRICISDEQPPSS
ncbi:hypothetical protein Tsubulata_028153 [Turnera subulata]|uniref:FRIGIDA-like protein n=1 Tax=Turnera subulata TaxID=218843 RepID=A0A9Q0G6J2_9ROSI|nr:hypothetical protein Tsubulata_028153 [Turnera subulata]